MLVVLAGAILWGESAFIGGRDLSLAALGGCGVFWIALATRADLQRSAAYRLRIRAAARPSPGLQRASRFLAIAACCGFLGVTRVLLYTLPISPFHFYLTSLYTERPAGEVSRLHEWFGPLHVSIANTAPNDFRVNLGGHFQAEIWQPRGRSCRVWVIDRRSIREH